MGTTTTETTPTPQGCEDGWTPFARNQKCYKWFSEMLTWDGAKDECSSTFSSILVSIPDEETNNFLVTLSEQKSWTGGRRNELDPNRWEWLDGTAFSFTKWNGNQPDNTGNLENRIEINFN